MLPVCNDGIVHSTTVAGHVLHANSVLAQDEVEITEASGKKPDVSQPFAHLLMSYLWYHDLTLPKPNEPTAKLPL